MKDRLRNLFDLAKPLVAEVVTDARDTAGWVVDKGRAIVDKAADISPVVIVRKEKVYNVTTTPYPGFVSGTYNSVTESKS
jgi:hypothetical protein